MRAASGGRSGRASAGACSEIIREGADMRHDLAGHARAAVDGRCYLFHVERDGEAATVLVDERGRVAEASGPRYRDNGAVAWGRATLERWGRDWPQGPAAFAAEWADE